MFTNALDHLGRKKVIVISAVMSPIIMTLLLFANSLTEIYVYIVILGLTYNTRSSAAYLYCTEFHEHKYRLKVGQSNFVSNAV